ncbi:MAG: hypothetical protein WC617_03445 [Rhodanobacter sp.]|jgi:hypothetical protein
MRQIAFVAAALLCGAVSVAHAADNAAVPGAVNMPAVVPFAQDAVIAGAVRRECQLGEKLSGFIVEYGQKKGVTVTQVAQTSAGSSGRSLVLEITDSVSDGNAFIGHHTHTTVKGKLYQDGVEVGNFIGRRNSMGGAFGGFKGNCSVLGRTVKALGEDIGDWLAQPGKDGMLGDLQ